MSQITIGVRHPGGTLRLSVPATTTLGSLKQQIAQKTNAPLQGMRLLSRTNKEFSGDSTTLPKLGIADHDLVVVDVPAPVPRIQPSTAAPAAPAPVVPASAAPGAPAQPAVPKAKTCACGPGQRCVKCMATDVDKTGYEQETAAPYDPTDPRSPQCRHGPHERCLNCRVPPGQDKKPGFLSWKCQHRPDQRCSNCVGVSAQELAAEKERLAVLKAEEANTKPRCTHAPGMKCINCTTVEEIDKYAADYDPRKHCRHHGPQGSCLECMAALDAMMPVIKPQSEGVLKKVSVATQASSAFGSYALQIGFSLKRVGICYGTISEDGSSATVEAIYEPPQQGTEHDVTLKNDPDRERVNLVAAHLGWKPVGWVIAHGTRVIHVETSEVLQAAAFQNEFSPGAVTLMCMPGGQGFVYEAYQVSIQATNLQAKGWFADEQPLRDAIILAPDRKVRLLERPVDRVPTLYLVCNVAIVQHDSRIKHTFPAENRPKPQTVQDYQTYVNRNQHRAFLERVDDFHLLLYLSNFLSPEDTRGLCEAVRDHSTSRAEQYKYVISDLLGV